MRFLLDFYPKDIRKVAAVSGRNPLNPLNHPKGVCWVKVKNERGGWRTAPLSLFYLFAVIDEDAACGVGGLDAAEGVGGGVGNDGCGGDGARRGLQGGGLVLDGVVLSEGLEEAGVEVAEQVEAIGIGGEALDGDGLHHRGLLGGEEGAALHLGKGGIDKVDGYVVGGAVAPLLEDEFGTDGGAQLKGIVGLWEIEAEGSGDAGEVGVVAAEEHELAVGALELFVDAAHKGMGEVDGGGVGGEEESVIDGFHSADVTPLLGGEGVPEGFHALALIALQDEGIGYAVGKGVAACHAGLVAFLELELGVVEAEMEGVALQGGWRVGHVEDLLHVGEGGLHALHPCLRTAVEGLHLAEHLLAVGVVHLGELGQEGRVHLVLGEFVGDVHVGEGEEACGEVFGGGEGALA